MNKLKQLLNDSSRLSTICGGANPFIAKLVEESGFDGVWLSSFEAHAWQRLPDAGLLSNSDYAYSISQISEQIDIPILVDMDEGGACALNSSVDVKKYVRAGAQGVCIEDNVTPKRSSLYNMKRGLETIDIMAGKIRAMKDASLEDFQVIARTEALVQELGQKEALLRAKHYIDNGADAILIHSVESTPNEIFTFADEYSKAQLSAPLICVPTMYPEVSKQNLFDAGFNLIIYANATIRAILKLLRPLLLTLNEGERLADINDKLSSVAEVSHFVGKRELVDFEKRYDF